MDASSPRIQFNYEFCASLVVDVWYTSKFIEGRYPRISIKHPEAFSCVERDLLELMSSYARVSHRSLLHNELANNFTHSVP
jgi:hypothetical protein